MANSTLLNLRMKCQIPAWTIAERGIPFEVGRWRFPDAA